MQNKTVYYPDSNRVGRFDISYEQLENASGRPMLGALFALVAPVIKVEPHESGRGCTYYGACSAFDELKEGDEIPQYRIEFRAPGHKFERLEDESRRVDSLGFGFVFIRQIILRVPPAQIGSHTSAPQLH